MLAWQALGGLATLRAPLLSLIRCHVTPNKQCFNSLLSFYEVRVSEPHFSLLLPGKNDNKL